jgi:hypothetical protein
MLGVMGVEVMEECFGVVGAVVGCEGFGMDMLLQCLRCLKALLECAWPRYVDER